MDALALFVALDVAVLLVSSTIALVLYGRLQRRYREARAIAASIARAQASHDVSAPVEDPM